MIHRELTVTLREAAQQFKVITILGPRQSGKTTLAQTTFKKHRYISLEDLDTRAHAQQDPREFLEYNKNPHGIILDEIQHVPTLLSYIQTYVDREKINGYFILTGSQNFLINEAITQTLAGRMAILTLMPLSMSELEKNNLLPKTVEACIYKGSYPQLYAQKTNIPLWYASYTLSYIERDVRQVTTINELTTFKLFLQMCAGRIGQQLNIPLLQMIVAFLSEQLTDGFHCYKQVILLYYCSHITKTTANAWLKHRNSIFMIPGLLALYWELNLKNRSKLII